MVFIRGSKHDEVGSEIEKPSAERELEFLNKVMMVFAGDKQASENVRRDILSSPYFPKYESLMRRLDENCDFPENGPATAKSKSFQ